MHGISKQQQEEDSTGAFVAWLECAGRVPSVVLSGTQKQFNSNAWTDGGIKESTAIKYMRKVASRDRVIPKYQRNQVSSPRNNLRVVPRYRTKNINAHTHIRVISHTTHRYQRYRKYKVQTQEQNTTIVSGTHPRTLKQVIGSVLGKAIFVPTHPRLLYENKRGDEQLHAIR